MDAWIWITVAAALLQTLRSALQKVLTNELSTLGATYSRFAFALPWALLYVVLLSLAGWELPALSREFFVIALAGGTAQVVATALLVRSFGSRNFAVGTTLSKTETVQAAWFGSFVLGESLGVSSFVAFGVSLLGVALISFRSGEGERRGVDVGVWLGLLSGTFFGVSAVCYRGASLSLGQIGAVVPAAVTLLCVLLLQTLGMTAWLRIREPGQLLLVLRSWRTCGQVGLFGVLGSIGWFTAMTLQNAAMVRAVGQVELLFTLVVSRVAFGEAVRRTEVAGALLVTSGILILLAL